MTDTEAALKLIRDRAASMEFRISQHAHEEMVAEAISLDAVLAGIANGRIIENYPGHRYCLSAASAEVDFTDATEK